MRKELDEALCAKYPLIFRDRNGDMQHTAMCWGFSCGDGWYTIIDTLCAHLTSHYRQAESRYNAIKDKLNQPQWNGSTKIITQEMIDEAKEKMEHERGHVPIASQVKEKFGGLRFYYDGGDEYIAGLVEMAEVWAENSCEVCGAPGKNSNVRGWLQTLCETHAKERNERTN